MIFIKQFNIVTVSLLVILVCWGCMLNYRGTKYSKIHPEKARLLPKSFQHCFESGPEVRPTLLVGLNLPNSFVCCDESRKNDLICISSNDKIIKWFSSSWAWIIPYLPMFVSLGAEILEYFFPSILSTLPPVSTTTGNSVRADDWVNPLFILLKENHVNRLYSIFLKAIFRGFIYFLIVLIRVVC